MDFKRVELIFLIVFLGINIFLLSSYLNAKSEMTHMGETNITDDLEQRLSDEKITFDGNFSKEKLEGYYLSAEQDNFADVRLEELLNQADSLDDGVLSGNFLSASDASISADSFQLKLSEFVKNEENIPYGREYSYMEVLSKEKSQKIFVQEWKGIPFNDESSQLTLNLQEVSKDKWRVSEYNLTHLVTIEALREKQELITERDAMITLYMNNKLPAEGAIKWRLLAYMSIFPIKDKKVYIPVWFIGIETNKNNIQIERVNAFTSAVISSGASENK